MHSRWIVSTTVMLFAASAFTCNDPAAPSTDPEPEQPGPTTPTCITRPAGVAAWWPADSDSLDAISGTGLQVSGTVRRDSAKVRNGFVLDASGGVLMVPDGPTFDMQGSFTIMLWLKFRVPLFAQPDYNGPGWDDYHFIVEKGDGSYNVRNYGLYLAKTTNTLYFNGIDTTGAAYVFNVAISRADTLFDDLKWHHLAVAWDATASTARIVLDGTTIGSATGSSKTLMTNTHPLYIGASNSFRYFVDGTVDEIMMYHRALSNSEMQTMIAADTTGYCR